jgi:hypothetical protein
MIGWWIVIAQETPDERDANPDKLSTVLASWESSLGGLDWLDKLAELGKAAQLRKGGYPNRYTAFAQDVLPLIANGPPKHDDIDIIGDDYVMPNGWSGNLTMHSEKIAKCAPDQLLTIDAWDLD